MENGRTTDVGDISWQVGMGQTAVDDSHQHNGILLTLIRTCTAALNAVTSPLLAVRTNGDLLFGNTAGISALRRSRWLELSRGRLRPSAHSDSDPVFTYAMEMLGNGIGSTVLLTDRRTGEQAVATVAPISSLDCTRPADPMRLGLVWLTTGELEQTAAMQLGQLFNLTQAEKQLLAQLVAGAGVRQAAERHKVSIHTARNQLKSILHKTGCRSQIQLLTLAARMASLQLPLANPAPPKTLLERHEANLAI